MSNLADIFARYKAAVFFDTETNGLDADICQIIELAMIRIEQTDHGTLRMADSADLFVKLPEGQKVPEKIVALTGITDERLEAEGVTEADAAARFTDILRDGPVLLVAHNAQFDLLFCRAMLWKYPGDGEELLEAADYLDSLTVYKDRRAYPHKLANAIVAYKLEEKVQNSHKAIDDVAALFEVCKAMTQTKQESSAHGASKQLREAVEALLGCPVPEEYWPKAERYARRKLERAKEMQTGAEHYDDFYLALLTRDTVIEMAFSDYTMALCLERAGAGKEVLE